MAKYKKINTQKSVAFLYASNEQSIKEIEKTVSFILALKRIKYLGINLIRDKGLHNEHCKTMKFKMSMLPKLIYRFNIIPIIKFQWPFLQK
jgi:hypothetical protein